MASGRWRELLQHLWNVGEVYALSLTQSLSTEERSTMMTDWCCACAALGLDLQQKFRCWDALPWHLLSVCNSDVDEARRSAFKCLCMYASSKSPASSHHPLSVAMLHKGQPLQLEMESFARGASLSTCPLLKVQLQRLRMVPIVERSIEAKHSLAKQRLSSNSRPSPATVSMALRYPEISHDIAKTKRFSSALTKSFDRHRAVPAMLQFSGLLHHPGLDQYVLSWGHQAQTYFVLLLPL